MSTVLSGIIALVAAALAARLVGRALRSRSRGWFIGANALIAIVALALVVASAIFGPPSAPTGDVLYGMGLGLGFGGLAGLRYGYKGLFEVTGAKGRR